MFKDELKAYVQANPKLVSAKPAGEGIFVLKYAKRVFYDNLWNPYLAECRGTIVDADYNLVQYPFTKIYNYGIEREAPELADDTRVQAYRKVNGFMVAVTWYNGDLLVSTTGSTDSDYVRMAKELIATNLQKFRDTCQDYSAYTFMFECVHRNDPHIISEREGMYYLGHRPKFWGSSIGVNAGSHQNFGCFGAEHLTTTVGTLKMLVKHCRHEGFVAYTDDGSAFKIKSPYYLTQKWLARNPRTDKIMRDDFKQQLDEEFYPLVNAIRENITEYTAMDEQTRLAWIRNLLGK
jgi:hypothetical protein